MPIACLQCTNPELRHVYSYEAYAKAVEASDAPRRAMLEYVRTHPDAAFASIMQCDQCEVLRIHPMPSADALRRFYGSYFGNAGYTKKIDSKLKRAKRRLAKLKRHVGAGSFLDVGCNIGCAVEAARGLGFKATGIEIGEDAVAQAKGLFPQNDFYATTAEAFAERGERFDLVYCTEVIEHVPDPVAFVKALAALVKPGGYLFLTTPDAGHWRRPKHFLSWHEVKPPEHVSWQTKGSLSYLFSMYGFELPDFRLNLKPGIKMIARRAG